jgi:HPt (histidine-containing phosphotransfer) domain-containing protein
MSMDRPEKQRPASPSSARNPSGDTVELRLGETATLPRPGAGAKPCDLAGLLTRCWGDVKFSRAVVKKFVEQSGELLAMLSAAAASHDTSELAKQAHTLRGMAGNLSAQDLTVAAAQLERVCRGTEQPQLPQLVDRVRREIERLVQAAPQLLDELASLQ